MAVNVDCSEYYTKLVSDGSPIAGDSSHGFVGLKSHSWYFGNLVFTKDLFATLIGTDRNVITTREPGPDGKLHLRHD
jgi:hypothetical protein